MRNRQFNARDDKIFSMNTLIITDVESIETNKRKHNFPDHFNYQYSIKVKKGDYVIHYDINDNEYMKLNKIGILHSDYANKVEVDPFDMEEHKKKKDRMFITPTLTQDGYRFLGIKVQSCKLFIGDKLFFEDYKYKINDEVAKFFNNRENYNSPYHMKYGVSILTDNTPYNIELILSNERKEEVIGAIVYLMEEYNYG